MHDLEKRLQSIRKVDVTDRDVEVAKERIVNKSKKPVRNLAPAFVTAMMFAILGFLVFVPLSKQEESATAVLTDEIKEVYFMSNDRPNLNFRPDSFNHILISSKIDQPDEIQVVQELLNEVLINPQPYTGKIEGDGLGYKQLAFKMESGNVIYLTYEQSYNEGPVFYDQKEKIKYVVPDAEMTSEFNDILFEKQFGYLEKVIQVLVGILIVTILFGFLSHLYYKKYGILDERGKKKRLNGWKYYVPYFTLMVPIFFMVPVLDTLHLGIFLLLFPTYMLVNSQLEIKYGVVRQNNIYLKFIVPTYCLLVIIGLLLILVV